MVQETICSVHPCTHCIQFEAKLQKPGLESILCMEPLDLVHIDYVKVEVTLVVKKKPDIKDVLVVEDHITPLSSGLSYQKPYGQDDSQGIV